MRTNNELAKRLHISKQKPVLAFQIMRHFKPAKKGIEQG